MFLQLGAFTPRENVSGNDSLTNVICAIRFNRNTWEVGSDHYTRFLSTFKYLTADEVVQKKPFAYTE